MRVIGAVRRSVQRIQQITDHHHQAVGALAPVDRLGCQEDANARRQAQHGSDRSSAVTSRMSAASSMVSETRSTRPEHAAARQLAVRTRSGRGPRVYRTKTIIATCIAHDVNPRAYLHLVTRLMVHGCPPAKLRELLPDQILASHPELHVLEHASLCTDTSARALT